MQGTELRSCTCAPPPISELAGGSFDSAHLTNKVLPQLVHSKGPAAHSRVSHIGQETLRLAAEVRGRDLVEVAARRGKVGGHELLHGCIAGEASGAVLRQLIEGLQYHVWRLCDGHVPAADRLQASSML